MAALSDATLLAISRISVGTPVTDASNFTAMTPAQVAAKFALSSYGGDVGSYVYALGADGDYDALDPDDPPVTDLGLWAVGAFTNYAVNGLLTGAVAGSPGTMPTLWTFDSAGGATRSNVAIGTHKGLPLLTVAANVDASERHYLPNQYLSVGGTENQVLNFSTFSAAETTAVWGASSPSVHIRVRNGWVGPPAVQITNTLAYYETDPYTVPAGQVGSFYNAGGDYISSSGGGTITCKVAAPQFVVNVGLSPPVLALSSAATTIKLAAITQREVNVWKPFVVLIEATTGEDPGAHQVLYSLSRSADELVEIYRATSTHQITLKIRSGGVDYTKTLGSVADNTAFSVKLNVFASFTLASLNVGVAQVLTAPKPSGVLILESIGCKHDGTLQWGGPIAECNLIHPAVWTAAQLEAA